MEERNESDERLDNSLRWWMLAFGIYLILSLVLFGRGLIGHFSDYYVGGGTDQSFYMWCLAWWPYALSHRLNPLFSKIIWAPLGLNLAWTTCFPLLAIVTAPVEMLLGPVRTYNIITLLMPPIAATCAFGLCGRLTGRLLPSLMGGLVFGFSAFMLGQLLGHMNQLLVFPVPILAYLATRRLDLTLSTRRFVALSTLTLLVEFLLSLELFAFTALVAGVAIGIGLLLTSGEQRRRVSGLIVPIAVSYAVSALLVSPYIYQFLKPGYPKHPLWSPTVYSADFLNLLVPTSVNLLGANDLARRITSHFTGTLYDQGAFIGLPLILIAFSWGRRHRREPFGRALILILLALCALAVGPLLRIAGLPLLPMPWQVFERLPVIKAALPVRLMGFAFLVLGLITAFWLTDPEVSRRTKAIGVVAVLVFMMPNLSASYWATPTGTPAFFLNGSSRRMLSPKDIVLPLPFGTSGRCMLWQAQSGMNFRMVTGLTGIGLTPIRRWPVINFFYGSFDLPDANIQLKAFIANLGITAIVMDNSNPYAPEFRKLLSLLNIEPLQVSGVSFYRIPPGAFAKYRSVNAVEMETRADRIRFETVIGAAAKYVRQTGGTKGLSIPRLYELGLFPPDWKFKTRPKDYRDVWAGPWKGDVGIGVAGTQSALTPLIKSYRPDAEFAYFPYPFPLHPEDGGFVNNLFAAMALGVVHGPDIEKPLQLLMMAFKPAKLQALAQSIGANRALAQADSAKSEAATASPVSPEASRRGAAH